MKCRLLVFCALLFPMLSGSLLAGGGSLYQQEIVISEQASPVVQQSAEALAGWLKKITGQRFTVSKRHAEESEDTIQLFTAEEARHSVKERLLEKLEKGNSEAFVLDSSPGRPGLRIIGASDLGVSHGVYRYLHDLGFRSLFPGENWQIVPKRKGIRVTLCLAEAPAFLQRQFFGTGGFSRGLPLDPDGEISKMWESWRSANRFGQSVQLSGHYGKAFIAKNKAVLEAHPEYRAMVAGKRVPMSGQFQLNYGNPELRELYIQDRLKELRAALARTPSPGGGLSVSVEPADGSGHCTSPEALALGSISDQVFGLANDVAKRIAAEAPGNYVNLYAYGFHADVPSFSLEKNVIVSVIPYGFNYSKNLLGDDLLIAWGKKAALVGLRDYWALPDWSRDKPTLNYVNAIPRNLRFYYNNKVRFFNTETTTSAGTAGITLYLASRILWNPEVDDKAQLNEFYDLAFGVSRAPMQRMLERWAAGFQLHSNELALSFRDLQEAYHLANDRPEVQARIGDFVTYVQYLRLLRNYESAVRGTPERHDRADALLRFVWQIRRNAMVQTFRITQLMLNRWEGKDPVLREAWDLAKPGASGWASVPEFPRQTDIAAALTSGVADFPVLFETRTFSSDLVPLVPAAPVSEGVVGMPPMIGDYTCRFHADRGGTTKMDVFFGARLPMEGLVTVADPQGLTVFRKSIPLNGGWNAFEIPVKKGQTYVLSVNDRRAMSQLRMPSALPLVITGGFVPVNWTSTKNWFFVPKGTRRFAVSIPGNPVPEKLVVAIEGGSQVIPLSAEGDFTVYQVPEGGDGKVWWIARFRSSSPIRLLNVPDNLSFSPSTLMIPRETHPLPVGH